MKIRFKYKISYIFNRGFSFTIKENNSEIILGNLPFKNKLLQLKNILKLLFQGAFLAPLLPSFHNALLFKYTKSYFQSKYLHKQ